MGWTAVFAGGVKLDDHLVRAPVVIRHGRDNATEQPSAPSCQFAYEGTPPPIGTRIEVTSTVNGSSVRRFTGTVTAVAGGLDGAAQITAHGRSALLGRMIIGTPVLGVDTLGGRFEALKQVIGDGWVTTAAGPPAWWPKLVAAADVDRKPALEVLMGLCAATGCLATENTNGILHIESPDARQWLTANRVPPRIEASWIVKDLQWTNDLATLINRVTVTHPDQTHDAASDATSINTFGEQGISFTSMYANPVDGLRLAQQIVDRWSTPQYQLGQVTVDSAPASDRGEEYWWWTTMMSLGVSSLVSIPVGDRPGSLAQNVWFVEGWDEALTATRHVMTLRLSPAERYGVETITWADWQTKTWDDMRQRTWLTAMEGSI